LPDAEAELVLDLVGAGVSADVDAVAALEPDDVIADLEFGDGVMT